MLSRFLRWLRRPPDGPGTRALEECARMLGTARRTVATLEARAAVLRERAERDEGAAVQLEGLLLALDDAREERDAMEAQWGTLLAKMRVLGVSTSWLEVPTFDASELRDEVERAMLLEEANADVERLIAGRRPLSP